MRNLAFNSLGRRIAIELLLAVMIGTLLGLLGPFDTYRMGAGPRLAYWIFMIVAGLMIFRPTLIASDWLAQQTGMPRWAAWVLAVAIGSLPMTLLVALMFSGFDVVQALTLPELPECYGNVFLISLLTNGAYQAVFHQDAKVLAAVQPLASAMPSDNALEAPSALESRLPAGFGQPLALNGEDHYVRVHGPGSSTLILIRLRDAIAELDPALAGSQVHRSWWVAREAVADRKSEGRAVRLVLTNGLEVPVSREKVAELRSAGWL